ncbi:MAG: hypothetical protein M1816_004607 [Peltula sp. TS41687]|nr:MAG: hypothetical protein M1816_004607 [Peltula sp. TS41687]
MSQHRPRDTQYGSINTNARGSSQDRSLSVPGENAGSRHDESPGYFAAYNPAQSTNEGPEDDNSGLDKSQNSKWSTASSLADRRKTSVGRLGHSSTAKPPAARRTSTYGQGPRRGQEFSVDDDIAEFEAQQQAAEESTATGRGSLKRKSSTVRRRPTAQVSPLPRLDSTSEPEDDGGKQRPTSRDDDQLAESGEEGTVRPEDGPSGDDDEVEEDDEAGGVGDDDDDESDLSDAESFTLKDRQNAINETHPFGIRVWKPALYKKSRSVQKSAENDIHSSPGDRLNRALFFFNILWTLFFGWWLACGVLVAALICFLLGLATSCIDYGRVFLGLAGYLFYPFGKFVRLSQDEAYAEEDEGEGRSITEYEQWQTGDLEDGRLFFGPRATRALIGRRRNSADTASENDSLLGRTWRPRNEDQDGPRIKRRLFGRGQWNPGRVVFYILFYGLVAPLILLASGFCWLLVFWIPMGKVTMLLISHLRRHPLALSFHSEATYARASGSPTSSILLCTYRAVGLKYWKYTIDGTNIILINLMSVVLFVIFDYWVLNLSLHLNIGITHPGFIFMLSLFSIIPLAYFIGQAVASISAQSSMGVGAAINAFFSTIVEVYLYCVALNEGKAQLVEGSIIGSIFAGILFLPGLSMCFGAIKRKTQRFNAKSAGVTSTMLLFAVIAAFGPTLFYQIYGTHELRCQACVETSPTSSRDCKRCYFSQIPAVTDRFYSEVVGPFCMFAAALLFLSYIIGLWFTLRTHAAVIWNTELDEKKMMYPELNASGMDHSEQRDPSGSGGHPGLSRQNSVGGTNRHPRRSIRNSQLYKKIFDQSMKYNEIGMRRGQASRKNSTNQRPSSRRSSVGSGSGTPIRIPGLSDQENQTLMQEVVEVAATAATVAAANAALDPLKTSVAAHQPARPSRLANQSSTHFLADDVATVEALSPGAGSHDAPNWSRKKSAIILLVATLLYAIIAEILVNTVDVVLKSVDIDEKFLGFTLFALVPNTTEFLNAISFAMNGNIALSMEIGSAYALQVCLLQIPALVLYSTVQGALMSQHKDLMSHTFRLIFPQWDMITVILCVFLLSYMYGEGKSNYFKGSILILSYLVVTMGFYLSGLTTKYNGSLVGPDRFDVIEQGSSFKTVGRGTAGRAW